MSKFLKLATARDRMIFMTDVTDHIAGLAGLTLTITASKNGAAFGSITPTQTDRGNGWYNLALTTSHTDTLGDLAFHVTGAGADPSDWSDQVVAELPGVYLSNGNPVVQVFQRKYGVSVTGGYIIWLPLKKINGQFAASADWTPGAADVKVMTDGGTPANAAVLPTPVVVGGFTLWGFEPSSGELTGKLANFTVNDPALEPMSFMVETFGHLSAMYPADIGAVNDDLAQLHDDWADGGRLDLLLDSVKLDTAATRTDAALTQNTALKLEDTMEAVGSPALNRFTADALSQSPTGGSAPSAAEIADAVWDEAIAGHAAAGSTGEALSDAGGAGTPPTVGEIADAVWDELIAGHAGVGSTGEALSDAGGAGTPPTVTEIADEVQTRTIAAVTLVNGLAANSVTAAALAADAVVEIQSGLSTLNDSGVRLAIGLSSPNLDAQLDALPTAAENGTAVWLSGTRLLTAGTNIVLAKGTGVTGFNDLSAAQVNAEADTALTDYDGPTNAELTTALGTIPAAPTAVQNADALLGRSIAGGGNGGRTVKDAFRALRNKTSIAGGTLTVTEEDDTTPAWTAAVTRTAGDPLSAIDPA